MRWPIGLHYGEQAAKEFANGKQQKSLFSVLDAFITARLAANVLACTNYISTKITALEGQVTAINTAIAAAPNDVDQLRSNIDTKDKLAYAQQTF